eukprot:SAG22_NODE_1100_length_5563_cov_24.716874_2_plen_170_part_00
MLLLLLLLLLLLQLKAPDIRDARAIGELQRVGGEGMPGVGIVVHKANPQQLAVVVPSGGCEGGLPLWPVIEGHWNLPYSLVLMAYYVHADSLDKADDGGGGGGDGAAAAARRTTRSMAAAAAAGDGPKTRRPTESETAARKAALDYTPPPTPETSWQQLHRAVFKTGQR